MGQGPNKPNPTNYKTKNLRKKLYFTNDSGSSAQKKKTVEKRKQSRWRATFTPRSMTRRQSRPSITEREGKNTGGRAAKSPKKGASPETGTGQWNPKPVERCRKQTGNINKSFVPSLSPWNIEVREQRRERSFFV